MDAALRILLTLLDLAQLERSVTDRNTSQNFVWWSPSAVRSAQNADTMPIVRAIGKSKRMVVRWQKRYLVVGAAGFRRDPGRPGRRPPLKAAAIVSVVHMNLHEKPPAATHWSLGSMAAAAWLSRSSVERISKTQGLKQYLTETFKLPNDKCFTGSLGERLRAGLHLIPPDKAVVLSVDEKCQIQALDRAKPGLPLTKGRAGTMTTSVTGHRRRSRDRPVHAAPPSP